MNIIQRLNNFFQSIGQYIEKFLVAIVYNDKIYIIIYVSLAVLFLVLFALNVLYSPDDNSTPIILPNSRGGIMIFP